MGRPRKESTQVVVEINGDYLVWSDGHLSGTNKELTDEAEKLGKYEVDIDITPFGPNIPASLIIISSPERAVAAMMGAGYGRARLLKAPKTVLDLLPFDDEIQ